MAIERYNDNSIQLGQTHLDAGDFIPPRVKIVQQMSDEANDKRAEAGDFFNTLTGVNLGAAFKFIPIQTFKQRILLVRQERRPLIEAALGHDLSDGDGLKCRSYDMYQGIGEPGIDCNDCPLSKWEGNAPPLCTETYNVAALTEEGELIILGFSKSSAKVGKRLFSMLRLAGTGAPWAKVYNIATRKEKNDKGTFYVPDVTLAPGEIPPPELFRVAEQWNADLGGRQIDVTPVDDEEGVAAAGKDF